MSTEHRTVTRAQLAAALALVPGELYWSRPTEVEETRLDGESVSEFLARFVFGRLAALPSPSPSEPADAWQAGYEACWNRLRDAGRLLPSEEGGT